MLKVQILSLLISAETRHVVEVYIQIKGELTVKKLLLLTSILTIIFASFGFAKSYLIKKEKAGKYVEISQADIEVLLSKGKVFQRVNQGKNFINIMIYD